MTEKEKGGVLTYFYLCAILAAVFLVLEHIVLPH
jgi:hypothetical protein